MHKFIFVCVFFLLQNSYAQSAKFSVDKTLIAKAETIQTNFDKNIEKFDYKSDSVNYVNNYKIFYKEKIVKLKELLSKQRSAEKLSNSKPLDIRIRNTTLKKGDENPNLPSATKVSSSEKNKSVDYTKVENFGQIFDLKNFLAANFPEEFYIDGAGKYSCIVNFTLDIDGKFKNVKCEGSSAEFNLLCALYIYSVGGLEKPLMYKNKPVKAIFRQPITLIFE